MIKNEKLTRVIFLSMMMLITFVISSCKKEIFSKTLTNSQKVNNAKSWYTEKQKMAQSTLSSSKGSSLALTFSPDWANAKIETIDGNEVISTSVETNLKKITGLDTRYYIVILTNDGDFTAKTVSIKNVPKEVEVSITDLYQTAFTNKSISADNTLNAEIKVFTQGFNEDKHILYTHSGKQDLAVQKPQDGKSTWGSQDKTSVILEQCIYYYVTTNVYDSNRNLIWTSGRQLVDVQCTYSEQQTIDHLEDPDAPIAGTTETVDVTEEVTFGELENSTSGIRTISKSTKEDGSKEREVEVGWHFYGNSYAQTQFKSLEKISIYKPMLHPDWLVFSITHTSVFGIGFPPEGITCNVSVLSTQSSLIDYVMGGIFDAPRSYKKGNMKLSFQEVLTYTNIRGQVRTLKTAVFQNNRSWSGNEVAGMP